MRGEADELLAVLRQDDRLVQIEAGEAADLRLDDARLRDLRDEAFRHDIIAEQIREVGAVENQRAVGDGHLHGAARLADREELLVVERGRPRARR